MTILYSDNSGEVYWPEDDAHDPQSKKYYEITYRPPTRQNSTAYTKGVGIVIPSTYNGCMYECVSGGISDASPPTFLTVENGITEDGDVRWKCKPLSSQLGEGDTITASTWSVDSWVTLDNPVAFDGNATATRVSAMTVPTGTTSFTLLNHITVLRDSGRIEEFDKSLIIPIRSL